MAEFDVPGVHDRDRTCLSARWRRCPTLDELDTAPLDYDAQSKRERRDTSSGQKIRRRRGGWRP